MNKIRVGIIFGGKSVEHEVSVESAKNIFQALDKERYEPALIGIDKNGCWHQIEPQLLLSSESKLPIVESNSPATLSLITGEGKGELVSTNNQPIDQVDVIFPIVHGSFGEDGSLQGLLKMADLPFVGADVLGSAIGMDKDVSKRLLRDAGINVPKFLTVSNSNELNYAQVEKQLGIPVFIKPVNCGSSVGISKVKNEKDFNQSIKQALMYDNKVIIEEYIKGREIECAVLGNADPQASVPGEIIPHEDFYSYNAKYVDENGASLEIPAQLPTEITNQIRQEAVKVFKILECSGMARVDFFLTPDNKLYVNEINTIPGFTSISMYPKLWEATGISYADLIDKLIQLAIERWQKKQKLQTSFSR